MSAILLSNSIQIESKQQIIERRKEIEQEIVEMLKETGSDFSLEDIKKAVYEEDDMDDYTDMLAMFDNGQGAIELENAMETLNDAWNYFPHKALSGISPAEKLLEYKK